MKHAIPTDWDHETFCRFAICWPDSVQWRALLRGLVTEPARGFFWDENTGWIKDVLADFRQTMDHNIVLPEVFMACNDQNIANALSAIAEALASNATTVNCGGGGSSSVSQTTYCFSGGDVNIQTHVTLSDGTNWPVFGTQPPIVLPPGEFPPGYPDQPTYDADKCRKATKIVDDWTTSIDNMGKVNWAVGVVGAAVVLGCIVGLITVPAAVIPLLLFALTANGGITALLIALANQMQSNRQELICILYEGENANIIISLLADALDLLIAAIPAEGAIAIALKSIALYLVNADVLNVLFSETAKEVYPDADCSSCGCARFTVVEGDGVLIEEGNDYATVESQPDSPNRNDATIFFNYPFPGEVCGPAGTLIGLDILSGSVTPGEAVTVCRIFDGTGTEIYTNETSLPPLPFEGVQYIGISSAVPFTMKFTFEV